MSKEILYAFKWLAGFIFVAFIVFRVILPYMDKKKQAATTGRGQGVSEVDTNWDASVETDYSSD